MRREWMIGCLVAGLTVAVYWPVWQHAFVNYDDPLYVTENWHVQAGISRPGLAWAFLNLRGEQTYWHPLTWVSHMLDCQVFGLKPGAHHLVNAAWHAANALVLLAVSGAVIWRARRAPYLVTGWFWFLVTPAH
jgi:protein O-mannosyl-transferase